MPTACVSMRGVAPYQCRWTARRYTPLMATALISPSPIRVAPMQAGSGFLRKAQIYSVTPPRKPRDAAAIG